jgi:hypothetical protein
MMNEDVSVLISTNLRHLLSTMAVETDAEVRSAATEV